MRFGKQHLQISVFFLIASVAYNVYYFGFRKAEKKPVASVAVRPGLEQSAPVRVGRSVVDPLTIPAPPPVDTSSAPHWARNPFLTPAEASGAFLTPAGPAEVPAAEPVVASILYSADRQLAIVDHHVVRVGDRVGGARVVEIARDGIVLDSGGARRRVPLKPPKIAAAPATPPPGAAAAPPK